MIPELNPLPTQRAQGITRDRNNPTLKKIQEGNLIIILAACNVIVVYESIHNQLEQFWLAEIMSIGNNEVK